MPVTGIVLFDHYTAQTWSAITMLLKTFAENRDIKRVVELGTGTGGLTLLFGLSMTVRDGKTLSFDIEPEQSKRTRKDFGKLNIAFECRDVFEDETVELARRFIEGERALVFCNGGKKSREFRLYSRIVKSNDLIMAHDYGIEIGQGDVDESMREILEPYNQEEFDEEETYILSMRRI